MPHDTDLVRPCIYRRNPSRPCCTSHAHRITNCHSHARRQVVVNNFSPRGVPRYMLKDAVDCESQSAYANDAFACQLKSSLTAPAGPGYSNQSTCTYDSMCWSTVYTIPKTDIPDTDVEIYPVLNRRAWIGEPSWSSLLGMNRIVRLSLVHHHTYLYLQAAALASRFVQSVLFT